MYCEHSNDAEMADMMNAFGSVLDQPQPSTSAGPIPQLQAPPNPDTVHTGYGEAMRNLLRYLEAVARTMPTPGDGTAAFRATWESTGSPATAAEMQATLSRVLQMPASHLAAVQATLDPATRQYFHVAAIQLADAIGADMAELAQAAAVERWVLSDALPALQSMPEEGQLGTRNEIRKQYAKLDGACRVARPDDTNPVVADLGAHLAAANNANSALKTRLAAAGLQPDAPETDAAQLAACKKTKQLSTTSIVLIVVVILAIIAIIVLSVMYVRKQTVLTTAPQLTAGIPTAAFGGVANTPSSWAFPRLSAHDVTF